MSNQQILNQRYQLDEPLATGGMAMIYRAQDLMLERTVAIKVLRADLTNDPEFRDRFRQEAKAAANLSHPNIVTVHDFGLDAGLFFIVMEYVPGVDLKSILRTRGRLPVIEALSLMIQACSGIGYAHRAGIVHCDIKPQNMLVTPDQHLKVVDFGIARVFSTISPDEKSEVVWGSPQYFSPEQAAGNPPSPASDVYSLGVVLFELVTSQLPFSGATPEELARQHRLSPPPSPRKLNPEISPDLEQILLKVLSKEPSARYRTADQMGRVLAALIRPIPDLSVNPPSASANPPPVQEYRPGTNSGRQNYPADQPVAQPQAQPIVSQAARPAANAESEDANHSLGIDWITWILVLLALIALGGLIPFWLWVYTILNPPL